MLKRKENNKICRKSQLLIVGSLLILIGVSILGTKLFLNFRENKKDQTAIDSFYEWQEVIATEPEIPKEDTKNQPGSNYNQANYIAVLKIPKIGLERGLFSKTSANNNVNWNIQIIKESDMPDVDKGNLILAGHSGNDKTSHFRNLHKLSTNDIVSVFYGGNEYKYKIVNSYEVEKNGVAHIVRNGEKTTLTLITCKSNSNKQIIFISELVEII